MRTTLALSATLALTLGGGLAACAPKPPEAAPAPLVRTIIVGDAQTAGARTVTGVVRARIETDLAFRIDGKIAARLVDSGARVRKGQPLFRMDVSDYALSADAAQAQVAAAQARAKDVAADHARLAALFTRGAVSKSDLDRVAAEDAAAAQAVRAAQAQAAVAANRVTYATVTADADGIVTLVKAEAGQVVAAGQPIARLARDGAREIEIFLPEQDGGLKIGAAAEVTFLNGTPPATARLREIAGAADPVGRTYAARFAFAERRDAPLGATATVRYTPASGGAVTAAIEAPLSALSDTTSGPGVYVVDPKTRAVHWRSVEITGYGDDAIRVRGGLKPGEEVVALGAHLLREGEIVRTAPNATMATRVASNGELR